MADTERTIAELLALFADNTSGDISEQDCRDLIVTFAAAFGGLYIEGNAIATTIAAMNTWYKVAGTTTASAYLNDFTMPADNRLTYDDTITRHVHMSAAFAITSGSNNQTGEMSLYKNGVIVPGSTMAFKTSAAGDPRNLALEADINMAPTDYLEVYVRNTTGANNLTVSHLQLQADGNVH